MIPTALVSTTVMSRNESFLRLGTIFLGITAAAIFLTSDRIEQPPRTLVAAAEGSIQASEGSKEANEYCKKQVGKVKDITKVQCVDKESSGTIKGHCTKDGCKAEQICDQKGECKAIPQSPQQTNPTGFLPQGTCNTELGGGACRKEWLDIIANNQRDLEAYATKDIREGINGYEQGRDIVKAFDPKANEYQAYSAWTGNLLATSKDGVVSVYDTERNATRLSPDTAEQVIESLDTRARVAAFEAVGGDLKLTPEQNTRFRQLGEQVYNLTPLAQQINESTLGKVNVVLPSQDWQTQGEVAKLTPLAPNIGRPLPVSTFADRLEATAQYFKERYDPSFFKDLPSTQLSLRGESGFSGWSIGFKGEQTILTSNPDYSPLQSVDFLGHEIQHYAEKNQPLRVVGFDKSASPTFYGTKSPYETQAEIARLLHGGQAFNPNLDSNTNYVDARGRLINWYQNISPRMTESFFRGLQTLESRLVSSYGSVAQRIRNLIGR